MNKYVNITREFNAPVEKVWDAFSNPETLMKWWGPEHFTSPEAVMDFTVGGKYNFCMQSPDGQKMYSGGVYNEIEPMKKIVATDYFTDKDGNTITPTEYGMPADTPREMIATFTFESLPDGRTKFTLHHGEASDSMIADMTNGWGTSLDKLQNVVEA